MTQALMDIEKINADCWEFMLRGRVDGIVANQLEIEILSAIKQNAKTIHVNLAEATVLCSAGIRVLLQYHRQMKKQGTHAARHPPVGRSGTRVGDDRLPGVGGKIVVAEAVVKAVGETAI